MAEETLKDIWETLTDKQKNLVAMMIVAVTEKNDDSEDISHSEELKHYGVLGMKWGKRKYQNKDGTLTEAGKKRYGDKGKYEYESLGTKRFTKKAAKLDRNAKLEKEHLGKISDKTKAKIASNTRKLMLSKKADKNYQKYAEKTSVGKAIAQNLIFGPFGARGYQQARANGLGRLGATLTGIGSSFTYYGLPVGNVAARANSRWYLGQQEQFEKKNKK